MEEKCCIIHVTDCKEPLIKTTSKAWDIIQNYANKWINTCASVEKTVASEVQGKVYNEIFQHHRRCYQRFCDKTKVERVERGERRKFSSSPPSLKDQKEASSSSVLKRRKTSEKPTVVLPQKCIICGGGKKRAKLCLAETTDAGKLREAAERKGDEKILLDIRDKDCVAIEVRYHRSCYISYTKTAYSQVPKPKSSNTVELNIAYELFYKEVVEKEILQNKNIYTLQQVKDKLNSILKNNNLDGHVNLSTSNLKKQMSLKYPMLRFERLRQNESMTILPPDEIAESSALHQEILPTENYNLLFDAIPVEHSDSSSFSKASQLENIEISTTFNNPNATLYYASNLIREEIRTSIERGKNKSWPPNVEELNIDAAKNLISPTFFNFIARCLGEGNDDPCASTYLNVSPKLEKQILSICQDLIFIESKGRFQTPKSLALGVAIHNLTRSAHLNSILNGFGHCVSNKVVINLESAYAQKTVDDNDLYIPKMIQKRTPTIIVWDNIDFSEETLSGKGTTHHTNGIIVQKKKKIDTAIPEMEQLPDRTENLPKTWKIDLKPTTIKQYYEKTKSGPNILVLNVDEYKHEKKISKIMDEIYILVKHKEFSNSTSNEESKLVLNWTNYNKIINEKNLPNKSEIGYLPQIEAPATDLSTVYTVLLRSKEIAEYLQLKNITLVADLALYSKLQRIRWNDEELKNHMVIRLGEFHTCMSYMSVIWKRFKGSGIENVLIESGVLAEGSLQSVLSGHHYNRSLRTLKIVYEALQLLRFKAFLNYTEEDAVLMQKYISAVIEGLSDNDLLKFSSSNETTKFLKYFNHFVKKKASENECFRFWSSLIEMIQLLLSFIRATRTQDWDLHIACLPEMCGWMFAYDHTNYARYLTIYSHEMLLLKKQNSAAYREVRENFTVQYSDAVSFSSVACDQAIEHTFNKDCKTSGGLIGGTKKKYVTQRWVKSQTQRAELTNICEDMANVRGTSSSTMSNKQNDDDVKLLMETIESHFNPFDVSFTITNLTSGAGIHLNYVTKDLLDAKIIGENDFKKFLEERLWNNVKSIYDVIPKHKLHTFESMAKIKKVPSGKNRETVLKSDRQTFARLLILAQEKCVDMKNILSYSLNALPLSLCNTDGYFTKTPKSALLHQLENYDQSLYLVKQNSALIIDGMAILHSLKKIPTTFGDLPRLILHVIFSLAERNGCNRVDFVTDSYFDHSIKDLEREKRSSVYTDVVVYNKISANKNVTNWSKFLSSGKNKSLFVEFLFQSWKAGVELRGKILFYAHNGICHKFEEKYGNFTVEEVLELSNDHEEADTKLILHAFHASKVHDQILISSPDTDVFLLLVGTIDLKNTIFITHMEKKYLNIDAIRSKLGYREANALLGLHCFTGTDCTSAFCNKGKVAPMKLMISKEEYIEAFGRLGEEFSFRLDLNIFEQFVCELYGVPKCKFVNNARYVLFKAKASTDEFLPPNQDALIQHLKRASYYAAIMKKAKDQLIEAPQAKEHGWEEIDGAILPKWTTIEGAPLKILKDHQCRCLKGCDTNRCSCKKNNIPCTEVCSCIGCKNESELVSITDDDDIDDQDEI